MTSINSLVKSEAYKRKMLLSSSSYEDFKQTFYKALCEASQNGYFQSHHEILGRLSLWLICFYFVDEKLEMENNIHIVDFQVYI